MKLFLLIKKNLITHSQKQTTISPESKKKSMINCLYYDSSFFLSFEIQKPG